MSLCCPNLAYTWCRFSSIVCAFFFLFFSFFFCRRHCKRRTNTKGWWLCTKRGVKITISLFRWHIIIITLSLVFGRSSQHINDERRADSCWRMEKRKSTMKETLLRLSYLMCSSLSLSTFSRQSYWGSMIFAMRTFSLNHNRRCVLGSQVYVCVNMQNSLITGRRNATYSLPLDRRLLPRAPRGLHSKAAN